MKPKVIAFFLPQYRPVVENDEWFGKGFTEWTSVAKSVPLFKGHLQPKVPSDLGFYDLRLPEIRMQQAELAKEAGISAFCYYHYWFGNNKTILEKTLEEIVESGSPDFPFCLCWANESWYKKCWHSDTGYLSQELLLEQQYPGEKDDEEHFYALLKTFKDPRYYRIKGKLAFVVYNLDDFRKGNVEAFKHKWQQLAKENGLPGFYFISYTVTENDVRNTRHSTFDATILSLFKSPVIGKQYSSFRRRINSVKGLISSKIGMSLVKFDYAKIRHMFVSEICKKNNIYPVLIPNWDNSPRRGSGGLIYYNSTPEEFEKHVYDVMELIKDKPEEDQIIFLKSWNEWGEGNYMEPDLVYGKGYIKALKKVIKLFE